MTQEQLTDLLSMYEEIGPRINQFVAKYGYETLREGIETINSKRNQQTSQEALTGLVSFSVSDWAALRAVQVQALALPALMQSFSAAMNAGSNSVGSIALAIAIAMSDRA